MNIKNLLGNLVPITPATSAAKVERPIKMDSSHDRDPNGNQYYQQERKKEKMTDEQFEKAIAILREKHFVKEMNWIVVSLMDNEVKYACVQDSEGQLIRKISEYDLWEVFDDAKSEDPRGQLLRKSA